MTNLPVFACPTIDASSCDALSTPQQLPALAGLDQRKGGRGSKVLEGLGIFKDEEAVL